MKITNPLFLGQMASLIMDFMKQVPAEGLAYENLYAYFANNVQHGGEIAEFHVAFEDGKPVGFIHFYVCGLPFLGSVTSDYIYSKSDNNEIVQGLTTNFIEFGKKHKAPIYRGTFINKKVFDHLQGVAKEMGYQCRDAKLVSFVARKDENENIQKRDDEHGDDEGC